VTRAVMIPSGGSGENPEPTVKVWMGEGILEWRILVYTVFV